MALFYPRRHTKIYEDTRKNHFVLFVVKDGALFLDKHREKPVNADGERGELQLPLFGFEADSLAQRTSL
jgi:hypothetical protein